MKIDRLAVLKVAFVIVLVVALVLIFLVESLVYENVKGIMLLPAIATLGAGVVGIPALVVFSWLDGQMKRR